MVVKAKKVFRVAGDCTLKLACQKNTESTFEERDLYSLFKMVGLYKGKPKYVRVRTNAYPLKVAVSVWYQYGYNVQGATMSIRPVEEPKALGARNRHPETLSTNLKTSIAGRINGEPTGLRYKKHPRDYPSYNI